MNQINYISQMTSIVERINNPPKLVLCMAAFNEMEFLPLTLPAVYDYVDQIIIVEGAVGERDNATPDGHSTDGTLEYLQKFKADHKKVILVTIKRSFINLEEQKNVFCDLVSNGDILCILDADEAYHPADFDKIRILFDRYPHLNELIVPMFHLYKSWDYVAKPGPEWSPNPQRIIKKSQGISFKSHPVATLGDGHCSYFSWHMQPRRATVEFPIFHFGFARNNIEEIMKAKQTYYEKELAKHDGANKAFDEKAKIFLTNGEKAVDFLRFDRTMIPEYMRQHPMWSVKNEHMDSINMDIADFLEDPYYGPWYKEMEVPNVYLCMNGISSPVMPKFSNRVFV